MGDFLEENEAIFLGLYTALSRTRSSAQVLYYKILEAQRQYFLNSSNQGMQETVLEVLDDAMHKFYLGSYELEQLWGVHHHLEIAEKGIPSQLGNNITYQQNELVFLLSSLLDQALYAWRAFLDYYLKYLLLVTTGEYIVTISTKTFRKKIEKWIEENPDDSKSENIYTYIKSNVLCKTYGGEKTGWGDFLKSLRDKTTHQKLIKPTIIEKENQQGFLVTWPTIAGQNYSELAQWRFENSAFEMIQDLFPILYEFEWVSGPYKPGMYK